MENASQEKPPHPTARALVDSALELLKDHAVHEVTLELVLQKSGISVGSLYHHFKDFSGLMDQALTEKYAQFTQVNVDGMAKVLQLSKSANEYHDNIMKLLEFTHSESNAELRKARAYVLSQATVRPGLGDQLRKVQTDLTAKLAEIIAEAQGNGWIQSNVNPIVLSTFIQAYGVGRIVDDLSDPQMDNENWTKFLKHMISTSVLVRD